MDSNSPGKGTIALSRQECLVCPLHCRLLTGQIGACKARIGHEDGVRLISRSLSSCSVEPIEKKPLWHYSPNLRTLSVGSFGCNMDCSFCANSQISQSGPQAKSSISISPETIIEMAAQHAAEAICFSFNEPIVYYEFVLEVAEAAKKTSYPIILKTNAYAEESVWNDLCSVTEAMNIDWKGDEQRYREITKTDGSCIRERIEEAIAAGIHVEISVPVYHDASTNEYIDFAKWLNSISPLIPVHLLKIFPAYKWNIVPVTSDALLFQVHRTLSDHLRYVYIANVFGQKGKPYRSTTCHSCGKLVASREGLRTEWIDCGCGIIKN